MIVEKIPKPPNPGGLEQLVLIAILRLGDKAYGVTIQTQIEERTCRPVATAAIYITLDRLAKKGYISSELGEPTPERGGRAKKYFKITALGEKALRDSLSLIAKMVGDLRPGLEGILGQ